MHERILITGGAGFIGSFVAARLAAMGHTVTCCDNFNSYYDVSLKQARVAALLTPAGVVCHNVELSDENQVQTLFRQIRPQLVIHLAAQAGVRHSITNPQIYIQSNLVAFSHLLEACRQHAILHLLYASSSSVYGANTRVPFSENDVTDSPVSLYAATKKANELMAHAYSQLYALPATGLRFFTVYGPWGRPDMAYFSFAEKMLAGQPIKVFADGELIRDFTFIDDIVEGVVRLLFKPQPAGPDTPHSVFNIGTRQPVRVLDFITTLEQALGLRAHMEFIPMQAGDVPVTHADTTKLYSWVGFKPTTSLESGLGSFAAWFRHWAAG